MLQRLTLLASILICFARAEAQIERLSAPPDSALTAALLTLKGEPIHLADVIDLALARSTRALDAKAALASARGALTRERGAFDPELFAEYSRSSAKQPTASPFSGAAVLHPETTEGEAGARITLPIGTELQASVVGQKLETNSAYASLNPEYTATGNLTVRQPLLNGFGPAGSGEYSKTRNEFKAAQARYLDAMAGVRADAEAAYWDLYAAERDLAVATVTRDLAKALLDEAAVRSDVGLIGPNQVNNAKVFLAQQELALLDAEDNLDRMSDALASLIGSRPDAAGSRFRTTDAPPQANGISSEESAVEQALQANYELRAAEWDVKAAETSARAAKWNALPSLDLFGRFGGNGLAGTGRDVIFGTDTLRNNLDTQFSDALDQALQRDYPSWTIGVSLTVPILLRKSGGERDRLKAELWRAQQRQVQTRRDLEERVRATYRELEKGRERVRLAEEGVQASVDQVRIGLIEFDGGTTTAFELVRLGADLADAQRRYSQALVRAARAAARMKQLAPEPANPSTEQ